MEVCNAEFLLMLNESKKSLKRRQKSYFVRKVITCFGQVIIPIPIVNRNTNSVKSKNVEQVIDLDARFEIALAHGVKENIFVVFGMLEPTKSHVGCQCKLWAEQVSAPKQFPKFMGVK